MSTIRSLPTVQEECRKADPELAQKHADESILRNTKGEYMSICQSSPADFGVCSIGLEMYFRFLKEMCLIFCCLTLIQLPSLIFNYSGDQLPSRYQLTVFDRSTIGNQDGIKLATTNEADAKEAMDKQKVFEYTTVYLDVATCGLFFVLLCICRIYNWRCELRSKKQNLSPASYAVQVQGLPRHLGSEGEKEVAAFFEERFGKVIECAFAREFNNSLELYKNMAAISKEINKEQIRCQISGKPTSAPLEKLIRRKEKAKMHLKEALPNMEDYHSLPVNRAFIIFDSLDDKLRCLQAYSHCQCCGCLSCACLQSDSLRFPKDDEMYQLEVSKVQAPSNIIWENLETSWCAKLFRGIIAFICVVILLAFSYASIYAIQQAQDDRPTEEICMRFAPITLEQAKEVKNSQRIDCFCSAAGIIKINTDKEYRDICADYLSEFYAYWALYLGCIFSVTVINFVIKYTLLGLSKFQKFATKTEEQMSTMIKLFASMSINMILLVLMTNLNFQEAPFFEYIHDNVPLGKYIFAGHHPDFDRKWHFKVGVTIIIMMCISVLWPQVMDFLFWVPWKRLQRLCTGSVVLQSDLNAYYEGYEFTLWDRYAYILAIIFFALTFSPGLPLLLPLAAAFCFVIYWIDKSLVLRFYKKPPAFTAKVNTKAFDILPFALLTHSIIALFVYTSPAIYPQKVSPAVTEVSNEYTTVYKGAALRWIRRFIANNGIPFLIIIATILAYIAMRIVLAVFSCLLCKKTRVAPSDGTSAKTFTEALDAIKVNHLTTYRIQKNADYADILREMRKLGKERVKMGEKSGNSKVNPYGDQSERKDLKDVAPPSV